MKKILTQISIGFILSSLIPNGFAQTVALDQSSIKFTGKQLGTPFTGQFKKFQATVQFDPKQLATSKTQIDIDLTKTTLPSKEAETELKGSNWFNVAQYPKAQFVSQEFKQEGNQYVVLGKLTLKGITKSLKVPFQAKQLANGTWNFSGKIRLNRADFKLGQGMWADIETVANEVDVDFNLIAK